MVEQQQLLLTKTPQTADTSLSTIMKRSTLMGAIKLCITESGLEDKEIYIPLDIDKGHFSKIMNGTGHFPPDKLEALMDLCGNEIPLIWLSHKRGYELKPLLSSLEQQLEEERRLRQEVEKDNKLMRELLSGRSG